MTNTALSLEKNSRILRERKDKKNQFECERPDPKKSSKSKVYLESKHRKQTVAHADLVRMGIIDPAAVQLVSKSKAAPEIGRSVLARRNFETGNTICSYGGDIISSERYEELRRKSSHRAPRVAYFVAIDDNFSVDGYPKLPSVRGHIGNYINDPRNIIGAEKNCCITLVTDASGQLIEYVLIEAIKPIAIGEELWLDYGDDYWQGE
jgi:hypothetical protein